MAIGDLLDEGEAEADAAGLLGVPGQAEERLEDALAHLGRNSGPAVGDLDRDHRPAAPRVVAREGGGSRFVMVLPTVLGRP